ncbi:mitochondrial fission ELM1 family protein [Campylobacter sp. VBCF_05 NA6]|uniref:ELM1/GtrOC1 family putative glycosyltransferase n=1 Tax=unclassified Campylobacter TaxID=2593542 RepID=UPI0022E9C80E|nr:MULTISPECIES: ELM1/GtrOC1 family putative glycosyltransferase [unclassified Campylobacter]MDA3057046.1 mitochondrial fission ELM1 family protein [Campylobacter sp. VBCF_04 NA7]MDA3059619.1 mitochondrial fission ELM1 family protein [Campylobacter sp. VBCF_05 NA6]
MRALIFTDGRKGHESQSVAFCELKGLDFELCKVGYKNKILKILSYFLDFLGLKFKIFECENKIFANFDIFVGAGSVTYYPLKYCAAKFGKKSVALMYPKGYKKDFSLIFANAHDTTQTAPNVVILPTNLNLSKTGNFYTPKKSAIGFVIGGPNASFDMSSEICDIVEEIKAKFPRHEYALTTSPRTPRDIEAQFERANFDFSVIYSKNQINPIGDFLEGCEWIFITQDSVSMISEAVCNGRANVAVLTLPRKNSHNKFDDFIANLTQNECLRIYAKNSELKPTKKINLSQILQGISL